MRIMTIDQSMANAAYVILDDGVAIHRGVLHTTSKAKPEAHQKAFDDINEQMIYISDTLFEIASDSFKVDHMVMESLSLGSIGDQTRNLAGLFHVIMTTFLRRGFTKDQLHVVAPTSVKSFARGLLPKEEQFEGFKKNGDPALVKMQKPHMVRASQTVDPSVTDGYNKSGKNGGKEDLADAHLIGLYLFERFKGNVK